MDNGSQTTSLEKQFEANRPRLRLLAFRMLGSLADADDAVQECWLRASRSDVTTVENFGGWLTTITSRVCIDMLRARTARREVSAGLTVDGPPRSPSTVDPEREVLLTEEIGSALMIVLERLSPAERVSYVLHDLFDTGFAEVAALLDRTEAAVRQLASRARRRVRGASRVPEPDRSKERELVRAFLAAARDGSFDALLELLSPDVVFRADDAGVRLGATSLARGRDAIIKGILSNAKPAILALINGSLGVVRMAGERPIAVVTPSIENGKIVEITMVAEPQAVRNLDIVLLAS